jgi:hypothetical protein
MNKQLVVKTNFIGSGNVSRSPVLIVLDDQYTEWLKRFRKIFKETYNKIESDMEDFHNDSSLCSLIVNEYEFQIFNKGQFTDPAIAKKLDHDGYLFLGEADEYVFDHDAILIGAYNNYKAEIFESGICWMFEDINGLQ